MVNPIATNQFTTFLPAGTNPTVGDPGAAAFLSPDSLMAYCETRLRGIDEQVQSVFASQQQANRSSAAISNLQATLGKYGNTTITGGDDSSKEIQGAFEDAIKQTAGDPAAQAALKQQYAVFLNTSQMTPSDAMQPMPTVNRAAGDTSNTVDGKEIQAMSDALKNTQTDMNSSSELQMIKLQSLMSQRQTAISTCTNLVSSLGESQKQIAGNLRGS